MTSLRFYFDFISPYAYIAWHKLRAEDRSVEAVPILFAALLDANGQLGPAEIPAKRNYVMKDVLRLGRQHNVEVRCPAAHPFNPLLPLRLVTAADDAEQRAVMIDAFYRAVWVERRRIDTPEGITPVLSELGLDPTEWLTRASDKTTKARLRAATEEALTQGVFGVPTVVVEDTLFWGVDSLAHLEHYLEHGESLDAEELSRWLALEAAAQRPGSKR